MVKSIIAKMEPRFPMSQHIGCHCRRSLKMTEQRIRELEAKTARLFDGMFDAKFSIAEAVKVLERIERMAHEAMQEGPERSEKRRWDDLRAIYVMAGDAARALAPKAATND
jgi:hypothetical protein